MCRSSLFFGFVDFSDVLVHRSFADLQEGCRKWMNDPLTGTCMLIDTCVCCPGPFGRACQCSCLCVGVRLTHIPHTEGDPVPAGSFAEPAEERSLCVRLGERALHRNTQIRGDPHVFLQQVEEEPRMRRPGEHRPLMAAIIHQRSEQRLWSAQVLTVMITFHHQGSSRCRLVCLCTCMCIMQCFLGR